MIYNETMKVFYSKLQSYKTIILYSLISFLILVYKVFDLEFFFRSSESGQILFLRLQDFLTLTVSIIIEAFPFIILGTLISVIVELDAFEKLGKFITKNKTILFPLHLLIEGFKKIDNVLNKFTLYSNFKISILGIFLPVCECGNIPVARRFMLKGYTTAQSVTFLLAAPIINPVTIITTYEAFSFDIRILIFRVLSALFIANFIGFLISKFTKDEDILENKFYAEVCEHDHDHEHKKDLNYSLNIFSKEFISMTKALIIGAMIASAVQVLLPREVIVSIGSNPVLSVFAMIILAFVVSICSNVDAFFALSYSAFFTSGSLLAFLVFGPLIDIKILAMLRSTFKVKFLVSITVLVTLFSILVGLFFNLL